MTDQGGASVLDVIRKEINSCAYRCPGGHRLDGVRGDAFDYADEMMDAMGFPEDWDMDQLAAEHPIEWKALQDKQAANWVGRGDCQQLIEIVLEYEGDDYSTYCYPVANGPCAAALGMDEDEEYERPLWQAAFERWRLEKILRNATSRLPSLDDDR